ncbi:MAG: NUDIX hydrolase, partial [Oscillospiraceae bacterium]
LREETGFTARELRRVGVIYPSPGYGQERLYMYIARGLCAGEQELDDEEFLSVKKMPLAEAAALALNNTIKDAKTVALLLIADRITE